MGASRFFVINLLSRTAQESRTKLSVHDPVRSFHPFQFRFGVQFAKLVMVYIALAKHRWYLSLSAASPTWRCFTLLSLRAR